MSELALKLIEKKKIPLLFVALQMQKLVANTAAY
jgi:hypothetical protein